jgi:hypothetical protein
MRPRDSFRVRDRSIQESKRVKQIIRKKAAPKVMGKLAGKQARPMSPAARISNTQIGAGAGIGTQPPKFVPQPRKR